MTTKTPVKEEPKVYTLGSREHPVRFSYLNAHKPKLVTNKDGTPKLDKEGNKQYLYGCQVHISKKDPATIKLVQDITERVIQAKWGTKRPANLHVPLRDGDVEWDTKNPDKPEPALQGVMFFNCSSKQRPHVVGRKKNPTTNKFDQLDASEIKSGDYGKVSVGFFDYSVDGGKGVGVSLNNIQLLEEGEPLGNRTTAEHDFEDEEDEETGSVL